MAGRVGGERDNVGRQVCSGDASQGHGAGESFVCSPGGGAQRQTICLRQQTEREQRTENREHCAVKIEAVRVSGVTVSALLQVRVCRLPCEQTLVIMPLEPMTSPKGLSFREAWSGLGLILHLSNLKNALDCSTPSVRRMRGSPSAPYKASRLDQHDTRHPSQVHAWNKVASLTT